MSRARMSVISALILSLVLVNVGAVIFEWRFWPVVDYPMFARAQTRAPSRTVEIYLLYGTEEVLLPREAPIFSRDFDSVGARSVVHDLAKQGGHRSPKVRRFLEMLLEARRGRDRDDGAPVPDGLRLYRVQRIYDEVTSYRPRIAEKVLLFELEAAK